MVRKRGWKSRKNLLNYVPSLAEGVRYSDGVLYSPTARSFFGRLCLKFTKRGSIKRTYLDDVGRFVVERINGRRDVREIGKELRENFGERVDPVYYTLALFLRQLAARRLITLKYPDERRRNGDSYGTSRRKDKGKQKQSP